MSHIIFIQDTIEALYFPYRHDAFFCVQNNDYRQQFQ